MTGIAIAAPVVFVVVLVATRPGPEAQAEQLFARMAQAIGDGVPGELVHELHPEYDLLGHFPFLDFIHDLAVEKTADTSADPERVFRESVRVQANRWAFAQRQSGPALLTWRIHDVGPASEDGRFEIHASLSVEGLRPTPTLTNHRFVLSTSGWLRPVALIRDHDRISLN